MSAIKHLGICIDENGLQVMEHAPGAVKKITLLLLNGSNKKATVFAKIEAFAYDIELERQTNYIQQLREVILPEDEVLLFGPTNLKMGLYNILQRDNLFAKTSITVMQTEVMTESQQQAFVMGYFESCEKTLPQFNI